MGKYASLIDKSTFIREILVILPHASTILTAYGIHCGSCSYNASETLREGLERHIISDEEVENLMIDLNLLYRELPPRPPNISIAKEAAFLLKKITVESGSPLLCSIVIDENQQLVLDVTAMRPADHLVFFHKDVPDVHIIVSPFLIPYVGGAQILVRKGRLTIDLPQVTCCQSKDSCSCSSSSS